MISCSGGLSRPASGEPWVAAVQDCLTPASITLKSSFSKAKATDSEANGTRSPTNQPHETAQLCRL